MNRFIATAAATTMVAIGLLTATGGSASAASPVADSGSASGSATMADLAIKLLLCGLKGGTMTSSAAETAPPSHCTV
ncbi:hypothetical protein [Nocardia tengchongensis]